MNAAEHHKLADELLASSYNIPDVRSRNRTIARAQVHATLAAAAALYSQDEPQPTGLAAVEDKDEQPRGWNVTSTGRRA